MKSIKNVCRLFLYLLKLSDWYEWGEVIYLRPITFDGIKEEQWVKRLFGKTLSVLPGAEMILHSNYQPMKEGIYRLVILKPTFFDDDSRKVKYIRKKAEILKLGNPSIEMGFLAREVISDKTMDAMGVGGIFIMHEPVEDSDGEPWVLSVEFHSSLRTGFCRPNDWFTDEGPAFLFVSLK